MPFQNSVKVSLIRTLPEAGSCKRNENPAQTALCACAEPVKMSFCIQDRQTHTVHTNCEHIHAYTHTDFSAEIQR